MTTHAAERRCGNCGTAVAPDAVMCPACDALLAAYEAPSGSATTTPDVQPAPDPARTAPVSSSAQSATERVAPQHPGPPDGEFSAEAAIEEARRTLGMAPPAKPERSHEATAPESTNSHPTEIAENSISANESLDEARRALNTVLASRATIAETKPAETPQLQRQGRKLGPPPTQPITQLAGERRGESGTAFRTAPASPVSSSADRSTVRAREQPTSRKDHPIQTVLHLAFIGIFAFIFLSIVRSFPFGVSPFIMIIFAIVILSHLLRIVAGATGRKTTTMRKPNSRSGWKR